jgi:hypothetical protein
MLLLFKLFVNIKVDRITFAIHWRKYFKTENTYKLPNPEADGTQLVRAYPTEETSLLFIEDFSSGG